MFQCKFDELDPEVLSAQVAKYGKYVNQLEKGLPPNTVVPRLKNHVEDMREKVDQERDTRQHIVCWHDVQNSKLWDVQTLSCKVSNYSTSFGFVLVFLQCLVQPCVAIVCNACQFKRAEDVLKQILYLYSMLITHETSFNCIFQYPKTVMLFMCCIAVSWIMYYELYPYAK